MTKDNQPPTLGADELMEASHINERLARVAYDLQALLRDATRQANSSPASRDTLGAALIFLTSAAKGAAEAHQVVHGHLNAAASHLLANRQHEKH